MRKNKLSMLLVVAGATLAIVLGGCGFGSETGVLKLNLTDAPLVDADVTGVYITITGIEYNRNGSWIEMAGFGDPQKYDLMELTNGESALLGQLVLPSGRYTQIRFKLDVADHDAGVPSNPGSYVEIGGPEAEGGQEVPLFVPSGAQTGYKAVGEFDVPVNGEVEVTVDFDVRKAVVLAGDKYILKPTLRLVVNNQAGTITGTVTGAAGPTTVVFAYESGEYHEATETAAPEGDATWFPNSVSSTVVGDGGAFTLAFLAAGTYDLVVADFDGTNINVVAQKDGVDVTAGEVTAGGTIE